MTALLPVLAIVAVALVVLYLVRESGEPAGDLGNSPVFIQTEGRPTGKSREASSPPWRILSCLGCGDEMDLDLHGADPADRGRAAETWYKTHEICNSKFPADNETQKQGAPGG